MQSHHCGSSWRTQAGRPRLLGLANLMINADAPSEERSLRAGRLCWLRMCVCKQRLAATVARQTLAGAAPRHLAWPITRQRNWGRERCTIQTLVVSQEPVSPLPISSRSPPLVVFVRFAKFAIAESSTHAKVRQDEQGCVETAAAPRIQQRCRGAGSACSSCGAGSRSRSRCRSLFRQRCGSAEDTTVQPACRARR